LLFITEVCPYYPKVAVVVDVAVAADGAVAEADGEGVGRR
jgi:hypothetical protein